MPSLIGSKSFGSEGDLCGHPCLEFVIRDFKEGKELSNKNANVLFVDKRIGELKCTTSYRNVTITETIKDDVAVALYSARVHRNNLVESVEGNIPTGAMNQM